VFYNITKFYDTFCWSTILRALRRIGCPPEFIDYIKNSLINTKLCIRTNIHGRVTTIVQMHKAVKQGCPFAPLLFAIVLDKLHCNYRSIGGYHLNANTIISSSGNCDDTAIAADNIATFKALHEVTVDLFHGHNLGLIAAKLYVMGRYKDGSPLEPTLLWPNSTDPIRPLKLKFVESSTSTRYLGLHINLDLDWTDQIRHMTGTVMATVTSLLYHRITPLQGFLLLKGVIAQNLELGFCQAYIPELRLEEWDMWLASALGQAADTPVTNIHWSIVFSTGTTLAFPMYTLTYKSDTTQYTKVHLDSGILSAKLPDPSTARASATLPKLTISTDPHISQHLACTLRRLYNTGIGLLSNNERLYHKGETLDLNPIPPDHETISYNTHAIPFWDSDYLWGFDYKPPANLIILICTDGSTFVPKPSGAAYVFVPSDAHREELTLKSYSWTIPYCDNYLAKLSGIHRGLRSLPVTANIPTCTDCERAHLAITHLLRRPSHIPPLNTPGRPYLLGIISAIRTREAMRASTAEYRPQKQTWDFF
jgi:hypothetical protein